MSEPENITPKHMRCAAAASCPSIHRLADGRLLIVGKDAYREDGWEAMVGADEYPIIISPGLLDELKAMWIAGALDELSGYEAMRKVAKL